MHHGHPNLKTNREKPLLPGPLLVPAAQVGQATLEQLGSHGGHLRLVLVSQVEPLPDSPLPPNGVDRVVLLHNCLTIYTSILSN